MDQLIDQLIVAAIVALIVIVPSFIILARANRY